MLPNFLGSENYGLYVIPPNFQLLTINSILNHSAIQTKYTCMPHKPWLPPVVISNICEHAYNRNCLVLIFHKHLPYLSFFFKILFIYLQREGKGGRKRRRETAMCGCLSYTPNRGPGPHATQACALTGNSTRDPLVCSLALNPLSHTSQGCLIFSLYVISNVKKEK